MSDEITSMTETERKYDVREDAPAPELSGFPVRRTEAPDLSGFPVRRTEAPDRLHATYYDTEDGALAAQRMVLRRRTGGHDEGWHLKTPSDAGRTEYHAGLSDEVPPALLDMVGDALAGRPLVPTADIRTERTLTFVLDDEGQEIAEV